MKNEITMKQLNAQPVLFVRLRTKLENLPQVIGETYCRMMEHLNKIGVQPSDAPYTAYHNLGYERSGRRNGLSHIRNAKRCRGYKSRDTSRRKSRYLYV